VDEMVKASSEIPEKPPGAEHPDPMA